MKPTANSPTSSDQACSLVVPRVAAHNRFLQLGEDRIVVAAGEATALRQVHRLRTVEHDVGDDVVVGRVLDVEFDTRVVGKAAVGVEADGPDLHRLGDRVVDAAVLDGDGEHAAARIGEAPRGRLLDVELRPLDAHAPCGVVGDRLQPGLGAAGRAVIEAAADAAVDPQAMDEPELEIGDEQLLGRRVVGNVAEAGAGVVLAVEFEIGEQRYGAGDAVDLPHRAGPAAFRRRRTGRASSARRARR